jgi:hypothetical protein
LIIVIACLLAIAAIAFVLGVRPKDLPPPEPENPFGHLDQRKAAIYDNLRDLQFEYRMGKLSDDDYQATKKDLQKELAVVLAEVDKLKQELEQPGRKKPAAPKVAAPQAQAAPSSNGTGHVCPSCGARFERELKFCGECGKPMKVAQV